MASDAGFGSVGLVGRREETDELRRLAGEAARGEGRCVLIAGDAGIGKTRLVGEVRRAFAVALTAQCCEEEASFPLAPLQSGLRRLLAVEPAAAGPAVQRHAALLAPLLPELAGRTGARQAASGESGRGPGQRPLFEAAAGFLFDIAADRPLVVAFEDLHWSDESTLAFFRFLARRLPGHPILLAGTYRPADASASLADLVAALRREQLLTEIALGPLGREEVGALLRGFFGSPDPVGADLLDAVASFSQGNPLYVEELLRGMVEAGDIYRAGVAWVRKAIGEVRVPASVQEAVSRRTAELGPGARDALRLGALAGREFEFELLADLTGVDEPALIGALKELIAAGFIIEGRPDVFEFRHPLLRAAVQGQLLARERRSVHLRIARSLERVRGDPTGHAAELAGHFYEAGAWESALRYSQLAGEQARRLDAPFEALSQFSRAVECARHSGSGAPTGLLLARAELYEQTGQFEAANADLTAALAAAEQTGQPRVAWQALLRLGYLWSARDYHRSLSWLERGLHVASGLDDPLASAETLNRIGNVYLNRDQPEEALPYHEAALAAFESAGDLAGQASTLELMGVCHYNTPDVLAGAECEERALLLARQAGARSVLFHASIHLLLPIRFDTEVCPPVRGAERIRLGEEALKLARAMGWPGGEAQALGLLGGFHGLLGQYDPGLPLLREGLRLAQHLDHAAGVSAAERMTAAILLDLLAFDEAAERLRRAATIATEAGAYLFADIAALALSQTLAERRHAGDLAEARALVTSLLEGNRMAGGRLRREALCARAEVDLAEGDVHSALATLDDIVANTRHLQGRGLVEVPRLALLLGRSLVAAERPEDAVPALEAAVAGSRAQGRLPLLWRVDAALGRLRLDLRQRRAAGEQFEQARALVAELAAGIPDAELRESFAR